MSLTALLFVAAFMAGCAAALARHPIYGLATYIVILFVHPPDRWWGHGILSGGRWSLIAAGVTALAILIHRPAQSAPSFMRQPIVRLLLAFVGYTAVQLMWVYDIGAQLVLIEYYIKFLVAMWLIYRCIETDRHLKLFLWAYVAGCFYLAWYAHGRYAGGRFDSFGGAGLGDANVGAFTMVTSAFMVGALFLAGRLRERVAVLGISPFLVNAMVMTISRSAFLAAAVGGVFFNLLTPKRFRWLVLGLSAAAVVAFLALTNVTYWERIATITYKGADVQGVDTGSSRLEIMRAQWRMFRNHPLGCGHFCTDYLSASYMDAKVLSGGEGGSRSSHNTFLSLLVDQGVVGGTFYVLILIWVMRTLLDLASRLRGEDGLLAATLPALTACLGAMFVSDMFVPYVRYEPRFWFMAVIIVMMRLNVSSAAKSGPEGGYNAASSEAPRRG